MAFYIELPSIQETGVVSKACVRFTVNRSERIGRGVPELGDIRTQCSCTYAVKSNACEHMKLLTENRYLCNDLRFILAINPQPRVRDEEEREWRCILVGRRIRAKEAMWIAVRDTSSERCPNYVPVYEGRGSCRVALASERRMRCLICRRLAINRGHCEHEQIVADTAKKMDEQNRNETYGANNTQSNYESPYCSRLPRRIICCTAETKSIYTMLHEIVKAQAVRVNSNNVDANGEPIGTMKQHKEDFVASDIRRVCHGCGLMLVGTSKDQNCLMRKRPVMLHTLLLGTVKISVCDMVCPRCKNTVYYDGRDGGIFAATRRVVYSRELLDAWLFAVAVNGATFREAYANSRFLSNQASARYFRQGNFVLRCNRRAANGAFSLFLRLIEYPLATKLSKIFSCTSCERKDENGKIKMRAVVMDGTATGILGELPSFERPKMHISAAKNTSKSQYLVPNCNVRRYMSHFFK